MKISFLAIVMGLLAGPISAFAAEPLFEKGATVLFQGDSITDMGRGRSEDPNHILGHGYAFLIRAYKAFYDSRP